MELCFKYFRGHARKECRARASFVLSRAPNNRMELFLRVIERSRIERESPEFPVQDHSEQQICSDSVEKGLLWVGRKKGLRIKRIWSPGCVNIPLNTLKYKPKFIWAQKGRSCRVYIVKIDRLWSAGCGKLPTAPNLALRTREGAMKKTKNKFLKRC